MDLSKEEIIDLALRYLSAEEITDFPYNGDLFCLLIRSIPTDRVPAEEEGWAFNGYGICINYKLDEEAKPHGKWLWMHFASLSTFPPVAQVLKMQPPHAVKGRFQSADRTHEIRIIKMAVNSLGTVDNTSVAEEEPKKRKSTRKAENIVAFRPKGSS